MEASSPTKEKLHPVSRDSRIAIIVLQFMIGGLVTLGGGAFAAFAMNDLGRALGEIHFFLGLIGVATGFVIVLRPKNFPRTLVLAINGITIAYSAISEAVVEMQTLLPSSAAMDSLIGTVIAIILSAEIIYFLSKKQAELRT